jgi:hypothetical protein
MRRSTWRAVTVVAGAVAFTACAVTLTRRLVRPDDVARLDSSSPYLKAHLRDGRVYVLSPWHVSRDSGIVTGRGRLLSPQRHLISDGGPWTIPLDSIVLFETNRVGASPSTSALAVVTGLSVALTVYCLSNTKACFGSCPTFYVPDGTGQRLMAEGFSASVAPSLEATDVDALWFARPGSRELEIGLANEALETHVIRFARVIAVPRPPGGRVVASDDGRFWRALGFSAPSACRAEEGDCAAALAAYDGVERFSRADSTDLAAKEIIELDFDAAAGGAMGLVVASRQTLLTTFLFYQSLAYMGSRASEWLALLERGDETTRARAGGVGRLLGRIEVQYSDNGVWRPAGSTAETGPIATDVRVVRLPPLPPGPVRLRLVLTRGHWRLDWAALAVLGGEAAPQRFEPVAVRAGAVSDSAALRRLRDSSEALVTMPGDHYTLIYRLPDDFRERELFLEARGYYLEWIREEWVAEENALRAALMFTRPEVMLRRLAPAYSRIEPTMEAAFWNSRYERR